MKLEGHLLTCASLFFSCFVFSRVLFLVSFGFVVVVVVVVVVAASLFVYFTSLKAVVPIQFIVT